MQVTKLISIVFYFAAGITAGCLMQERVDIAISGDSAHDIEVFAKRSLLAGYDLIVRDSALGAPMPKEQVLYCTIDRPAYAHDYLKKLAVEGSSMTAEVVGASTSCGERDVTNLPVGRFALRIFDPATGP